MKRLPVTVLAGVGALVWGVLLLAVWAVHPVQSYARYVPVENPTAEERASIEQVFREVGGSSPVVGYALSCESSPLEAAVGSGAATTAPPVPTGFRYEEETCSSAYADARVALWMNTVVIVAVIGLSVALHLRRRPHPVRPDVAGRSPRP